MPRARPAVMGRGPSAPGHAATDNHLRQLPGLARNEELTGIACAAAPSTMQEQRAVSYSRLREEKLLFSVA